jgi:GDP-L-fucose synthase
MKKILITGGSGFLGKQLIPYLENKAVQITSINSKQVDLTNQSSLSKIPVQNYDHILHLAAWTQAGDFCLYHGGEQWIINQQINTNMLAWWQKNAPQAKMIALGTSVSYATENDLTEIKYLEGIPSDKFSAYAMSKRMLLNGLQSLHKQFSMNYLYVIPSTLYGPYYHTDGRQMHFIFDLVRKILRGKLYGESVVLWGDGYQRRELIFVNDFIDILWKLNKLASNDHYNIGAGIDYSIRNFAQTICEITGYDFKKIQFDINGGYVGARSKVLNISKMLNKVEHPTTPLNKVIKLIVDWFLEKKDILLNQ